MVEPLGSVMSMQAQGSVQVKQAAPAEKVEIPEQLSSVQEVARVDKTVNVVDNAKNKNSATGEDTKEQKEQNTDQIRKAVETLNKRMKHSEAVFGIHEGTNRVMIRIVDKDTKEVIKELPPEKTLDMIAKVWEMAGILIDEKR